VSAGGVKILAEASRQPMCCYGCGPMALGNMCLPPPERRRTPVSGRSRSCGSGATIGTMRGYLSQSAGLTFADVLNILTTISKVPASGWGQYLYCMANILSTFLAWLIFSESVPL
jgi:hypothetical protein